MKTFKVTGPAQRDLEAAVEFLLERSELAALNLIEELYDAFRMLLRHPRSGNVRAHLAPAPIRVWVVNDYLVFYRNTTKQLLILAIWYGARNLTPLLRSRLK
ncbi:type II toxin-antitoxin system RelE/ParE family toxin [Terriglobus tenax]|uniref:type II toxin-antitoxin system RelE/ParE family toxin n=1 Tax=Terriglobus tenax TaxID=1111115 RepID=UPI0021E09067|nr:type II toxin-antitoxin system RelE/ParE family toxin [Terriglobus tenax]